MDLHPSLEEAVISAGLERTKLTVGFKVLDNGEPDLSDREDIPIADGTKGAIWTVPSIRALFRGNAPAPNFPSGEPPKAYLPIFLFIEQHVIAFSEKLGDKTDGEFEEVYNTIRRRPDGKTLNSLHFYLWQVAALVAGRQPISAGEFDSIFGRLTRSARTFGIGPVSRNYVQTLRMTSGY